LNAIKAFEAAARLGSFTRAAEELNVTHGAVSRQIRLLEDWLGVRLFLRTSRNAVPTQAGTELLAEAGPALDRLAVVSRRMQNRARAHGLLHVSALPTFAMRWLIPASPTSSAITRAWNCGLSPRARRPSNSAWTSMP
jgi:LysR family glycine cleavage system transcriptional activator